MALTSMFNYALCGRKVLLIKLCFYFKLLLDHLLSDPSSYDWRNSEPLFPGYYFFMLFTLALLH